MTFRIKTAFLIGLTVLSLWFFYVEIGILTPFVMGAIFAYLFNPVVDFFHKKIKIPRSISIIIIYVAIISIFVFLSALLTKQLAAETSEFKLFVVSIPRITSETIASFPPAIRTTVKDYISSLEQLKFITSSMFNFFPRAISGIVGIIVFLFSAFYFLKAGGSMYENFINFLPLNYRGETRILLHKINGVLNSYLRWQLFFMVSMTIMFLIGLSILGLKFALILAIFSGFLEIIPIIGPIVAVTVSALVALSVGHLNFSLTPLSGMIAVIIAYLIARELQDYLIKPAVMRRIIKVHPLIILFAVLAGQHLAGILGIILAVPTAAVLKILLEFSFDRISKQ